MFPPRGLMAIFVLTHEIIVIYFIVPLKVEENSFDWNKTQSGFIGDWRFKCGYWGQLSNSKSLSFVILYLTVLFNLGTDLKIITFSVSLHHKMVRVFTSLHNSKMALRKYEQFTKYPNKVSSKLWSTCNFVGLSL